MIFLIVICCLVVIAFGAAAIAIMKELAPPNKDKSTYSDDDKLN